jgi:hypothetical protein
MHPKVVCIDAMRYEAQRVVSMLAQATGLGTGNVAPSRAPAGRPYAAAIGFRDAPLGLDRVA